MPARGRKRSIICLVAVLLLGVSACTTTVTGAPAPPSPDQALQDHIKLGLSYLQKDKRQPARDHFQRALEIDKRSAGAHHGMALLFQVEKEYDLAEKHYKNAISYDKNFTLARTNYGVFLFGQQRYKDAYKQFEIAASDVNYAKRAQVCYSLGVSAKRIGKLPEAKAAWEKSLSLDPNFAMPYLDLAEYYFDEENFAEAKKSLDSFEAMAKPLARSLWLGVRLANYFADKDAAASKGLALTKLFPDSAEARQYREMAN